MSASASMQMERNVDRLLRSLVGVLDYAATWSDTRRLQRLDILKDAAVEEHQLVRNVVSGLGAGCGIRLERSSVRVFACQKMFESLPLSGPSAAGSAGRGQAATSRPEASAPLAASRPGREAPLNGNGHHPPAVTRRPGDGSAGASPAPPPAVEPPVPMVSRPAGTARSSFQVIGGDRPAQTWPSGDAGIIRPGHGSQGHVSAIRLDQLEFENRGATLRCRVVLSAGEHVYSAIAETPGGGAAEADLAAGVTLDALRAGSLTTARMEGVGFTAINGRTYIVAALREPGAAEVRAGSAPVQDSVGRAAAVAMLAAVGPVAMEHQEPASLRLG
ncbi:MAG TPA: hypothetical protein VK929_06530 [Longimicrobiales bacterium]|nr:hypothetical protein [Longimicrobiales bacterium]